MVDKDKEELLQELNTGIYSPSLIIFRTERQ